MKNNKMKPEEFLEVEKLSLFENFNIRLLITNNQKIT